MIAIYTFSNKIEYASTVGTCHALLQLCMLRSLKMVYGMFVYNQHAILVADQGFLKGGLDRCTQCP